MGAAIKVAILTGKTKMLAVRLDEETEQQLGDILSLRERY